MSLPNTGPVKVRSCPLANQEHAKQWRSFAHVGHKAGTICIADALRDLPENYLYGILLHELGHLALMPGKHSERAADVWGGDLAGIRIRRTSLQRLEFVATHDLPDARRAVYRFTDYRPLRGAPRLVVEAGRGVPLPESHP